MLVKDRLPEKVLISFVGSQDPWAKADGGGTAPPPGPILTFLAARGDFDRVLLLATADPGIRAGAAETEKAIRKEFRGIEVESFTLGIEDPTSHSDILRALRQWARETKLADGHCDIYISIASGTPAIHASWLLLAAGFEMPGRILYVRSPQFTRQGASPIVEINPRGCEFPGIGPMILPDEVSSDPPDLCMAMKRCGIVGRSASMMRALKFASQAAPYDEPVLILGESGTGKELVARLVHETSKRRDRTFLSFNCAGIPDTLAVSELFGYERGAFTGAQVCKPGLFKAANGGTLFLDEIGDMSPDNQAKLLRATENREILPLGAQKPEKIDVRIIAATNQDLEQAVKERRFRYDLFQRINVVTVELPALRERKSDIAQLAQHFLDRLNSEHKKKKFFSGDFLSAIRLSPWPGNVRQLRNAVSSAFIQSSGREITSRHLRPDAARSADAVYALPDPEPGFSMKDHLTQTRHRLIERALAIAGGNRSEAARLLGIKPQAVAQYLKGNNESS